jgi:hypothetical protein
MLKNITLAMVLLGAVVPVAGTLPALAQGATCNAPPAPAIVDPAKATVEQMRGLLSSAQGFMAASDAYQTCLGNDLQAQKDQAKKDNKPFDAAIETAMNAKVDANQGLKVKVGNDANAALLAFKKAHACDGKPLANCQ